MYLEYNTMFLRTMSYMLLNIKNVFFFYLQSVFYTMSKIANMYTRLNDVNEGDV